MPLLRSGTSKAARWLSNRGIRIWQVSACVFIVCGYFFFLSRGPAQLPSDDGVFDAEPKPGHMPNWLQGHSKLAEEMARACQAQQVFDLLWYGDSITESFREQVRGGPCAERCDGIASVWDSVFGPRSGYRAAAFGSSGGIREAMAICSVCAQIHMFTVALNPPPQHSTTFAFP